MLEDLKKKSLKSSMPATIILFIIAIILAAIAGPKIINIKNFEDLEPDEIKDQNVRIGVTVNIGCFLEEWEEDSSTHIRKTKYLYYVIPTGDEITYYTDESLFMSIKVPVKYKQQMEDIMNGARQKFSDPVYFVGHIRKLDSAEYNGFKRFCKYAGETDKWIEENTLPYYIEVTGTSIFTGSDVLYVIMLAGAGLLVLWGVVRIIKAVGGGYIRAFTRDIQSAGYTETTVFSDLNHAFSFSGDGIKVGRLFFFYGMNDTVPRAIPVSKLLWAYQNTTTHHTNGIKTGTTYSLMIYADGNKAAATINVPSEAVAQGVLQQMNLMYPWVVVGYSDEIKKLFNKDRAQFLQLRYNTVEHTVVEPGFGDLGSTL